MAPPPPPPGYAAPPDYQSPPPGYAPQLAATHGLALPPGVTLSSPGKRFAGLLLSVVLMILLLGIGYLIWAIIVWTKSTTPAKQLLRMKVVNANTLLPASTGKMWMRQVVWSFVLGVGSSITFGILGLVDAFMVFGDKRQRLLDRMADTYVVDDPNDAWGRKAA